MIYLYRSLYFIIRILIFIVQPFLTAKNKKLLHLRSSVYRLKDSPQSQQISIWFHASSGEIEYAKPLIYELKKQPSEYKITVTYSSESAEKLFENLRHVVDEFIPLCWDQPGPLKKLFQHIQPRLLIISRTDLWPEMLTQAQSFKVPFGIVSYFPNLTGLNSFFLRKLLQKANFISCVDFETAEKIKTLLSTKQVSVTSEGDTRFDQVFNRLEAESKLHIASRKKLFVCGSTWPEDEKQLFSLFPEVLSKNYQIILSPHEVSEVNINAICEKLRLFKFTFQFLSKCDLKNIELTADFLIVDHIGFLADVYRFGHIAFVGGSFKSRVHSVMEPLCCGLPVLVGPFYKNNPEALKYAHDPINQYVYPCHSADELKAVFLKLSTVDSQKNILHEMKKNQGATKKIVQIILNKTLKTTNF